MRKQIRKQIRNAFACTAVVLVVSGCALPAAFNPPALQASSQPTQSEQPEQPSTSARPSSSGDSASLDKPPLSAATPAVGEQGNGTSSVESKPEQAKLALVDNGTITARRRITEIENQFGRAELYYTQRTGDKERKTDFWSAVITSSQGVSRELPVFQLESDLKIVGFDGNSLYLSEPLSQGNFNYFKLLLNTQNEQTGLPFMVTATGPAAIEQGGYRLIVADCVNGDVERNGLVCLLVYPDGRVAEVTIAQAEDRLRYDLTEGNVDSTAANSTVSLALDAKMQTARISNAKISYTVDFKTKEVTEQRSYSPALLAAGQKLAQNADGSSVVYGVDGFGQGDAISQDLVLVNGQQPPVFLGKDWDLARVTFATENRFAVITSTGVTLFDTQKGAPATEQLQMDWGSVTDSRDSNEGSGYIKHHAKYLPNNAAYDAKNKLWLVSYRANTLGEWKENETVFLATFNEQGKLLKTFDFGVTEYIFHNNHPWIYSLLLDDKGNVTLVDDRYENLQKRKLATIGYLS